VTEGGGGVGENVERRLSVTHFIEHTTKRGGFFCHSGKKKREDSHSKNGSSQSPAAKGKGTRRSLSEGKKTRAKLHLDTKEKCSTLQHSGPKNHGKGRDPS